MKPTRPILLHKARFLLEAMERYKIRSFADLGGSWGVHGGYSLQALLPFNVEHGYLIDSFMPAGIEDRFKVYPDFKLVKGAFGNPATVAQIEPVDAFFMFDILLHQVNPDWDDILALYAEKTRHMIIYNQQWVEGETTIRLFELGEERYFRHSIYGARNTEESRAEVAEMFAKLSRVKETGTPDPSLDKPDIWQWGITTPDLIAKMSTLGFRLDFMENYGNFPGIPGFDNIGFYFTKS